VSGATITLSNGATGQKITTTSKGGGEYQLQQILPAQYLITVMAQGFGSQQGMRFSHQIRFPKGSVR
jgi:hypothetical protein